jgi:hypothetical protein
VSNARFLTLQICRISPPPAREPRALPVCDLLLGTDCGAMPCASRLHTAWIGTLAASEQRKAQQK